MTSSGNRQGMGQGAADFRQSSAGLRQWAGSVLVRAAVLLPASMAAWWFLLKRPSLWLLGQLAVIPLGFLVAPGGTAPVQIDPGTHDWTFNVAVNASGHNVRTGADQFVDSLEFTTDEDSVAIFASGWFAYLALAAAAGAFTRKQISAVVKGLGIQTLVNILMLATFAYINGYGAVVNTRGTDNEVWMLKYVYHMIYLVIPFAGPFGLALLMHEKWRQSIGFVTAARGRSSSHAPRDRSHRIVTT